MKNRFFLAMGMVLTGVVSARADVPVVLLPHHDVFFSGYATTEMTNPAYWNLSDSVLMTPSQIDSCNATWLTQANLRLWDLSATSVSRSHVLTHLQDSSYYQADMYLGGTPITWDRYRELMDKALSLPLPDTIDIQYALVSHHACVRAFPTTMPLTSDTIISGPQTIDDIQGTCLYPGEGVQIWHATADGQWLYVRARDYEGWVQSQYLALCSRSQMLDYIGATPFVVTLGISHEYIGNDTVVLNAGVRLPARGNRVLWPMRDARGHVRITAVRLQGDTYQGYVPFTSLNALHIAFRQLGTPYDWGGMNGLNDCSGLAHSVYKCFGFTMPRDGSQQGRLPMTRYTFGMDTIPWAMMPPASLIFSRTHVMLYLGQRNGEPYIIHTTNHQLDKLIDGHPANVCGTMVSSLTDTIGRSRSLMSYLTHVLVFQPNPTR